MGVGDPWYENALNSVGHVAWLGLVLTVAALLHGSAWAIAWGAFSGLAHGAVIEFLKETPDSWDTYRDWAEYTLGGLGGGFALWLL